jgi:SAM-dependent methyltransferase
VELTKLPFDQYGRYRIIADALDSVRPSFGGRLRILDVGGYFRTRREIELLPAQAFLPADDVTVLDRPECGLSGYVQGDGRGLRFADFGFDFVISCDTLEHVPAEDRVAFWQELLRVARYGVLLIAPAKSAQSEAAEQLVSSFIQAELGQIQPQLAEHRAYGLPDPAVIAPFLNELGLRYHSIPSGNLHAWVLMMIARHTQPICYDEDFGEQIDAYYTRFLSAADRSEPAYRRLWLVEKQEIHGWFETARAALATTSNPAREDALPGWADLVNWQLQIAGLRRLGTQPDAQTERIRALEQEVALRTQHIADLEQRAVWLEQQAKAATAALERVLHGRVMRILRWMSR